jgi:hypothetical protein
MKNLDDEILDLNLLDDVYSPDKDPVQRFETINNFAHHLMPEWFLPMLNDTARNKFYSKMLHNTVKDKVVIDLGSGTGMWSIEALALGARFVYVVEKNPVLIKYLEFIFKDHPVKVIAKDFSELTIADFNQGEPEALVHEIFSNTGLGEGLITAFQKVSELFPKNDIAFFPRYFWFEGRVVKQKPMELSDHEKAHLKEKADAYLELVHSMGLRSWGDLSKIDFSQQEVFKIMFLDLKDIDKNRKYALETIPLDISPGYVHRVYLSFRFSANIDGPFFDTLFEENHWSGLMVEFYASNKMAKGRKYLKLNLNDNLLLDQPELVDKLN